MVHPGDSWFKDYAILGDDIVIADSEVARVYQIFLAKLGVPAQEEKSVISDNGSAEFAKRFIYRGIDLSPISFKMVDSTRACLTLIHSLFLRLSEFRTVRLVELFRLYGAGYRVCSAVGNSMFRPQRKLPISVRWFRLWLVAHSPLGPFPWRSGFQPEGIA